jgi:hypothetical protein
MPNIKLDKNTKHVLTIQKCVRGYLARKLILIPPAYYQTKEWRKKMKWYKDGKSNECEKYQINLIEKMIKTKVMKTHDRINTETYKISSQIQPMMKADGYEWTENFDGLITNNNRNYYFNLKFVCEAGGAQTRTLREVYHFINYQLEHLRKHKSNNLYFINILDGYASYKNMSKFSFLINKKKYKNVRKYIFVGSLYDFQLNKIKNDMINIPTTSK